MHQAQDASTSSRQAHEDVQGRPAVQHDRRLRRRRGLVRRHVGHAEPLRRGASPRTRRSSADRPGHRARRRQRRRPARRLRPALRVGRAPTAPATRAWCPREHAAGRARRLRVQRQRLASGCPTPTDCSKATTRRCTAGRAPPGRPRSGERVGAERHLAHAGRLRRRRAPDLDELRDLAPCCNRGYTAAGAARTPWSSAARPRTVVDVPELAAATTRWRCRPDRSTSARRARCSTPGTAPTTSTASEPSSGASSSAATPASLAGAGALWAEPFDAADPVTTPSGLAPAPDGGADPVLVNLGRAVQVITKAGFTRRRAPSARCSSPTATAPCVPIHGGNAATASPTWSATAARSVPPNRSPSGADQSRRSRV